MSTPFLTRRPEGRSTLPGDIGMRVGRPYESSGRAHQSSIDPALLCSGEGAPTTICRSLPIRLPPADDEALDSYLEALAYRSHTAWDDILGAVGLGNSSTESGTGIYAWLLRLTGSQSSGLSRAAGMDITRLESMTIAGLIPSASNGRRPTAAAHILRAPARSRYCPQCLADSDGRWQLWWRLRWAIACPKHCCLLADCCPVCGCWQRVGPPSSDMPGALGLCSRKTVVSQGGKRSRCGAVLSESAVPSLTPDHSVLIAQRRILRCLSRQRITDGIYARNPVDVPQFLADIAALGNRALRSQPADIAMRDIPTDLTDLYGQLIDGDIRPPPGGDIATTAAGTAFALGAALHVVDSREVRDAGKRLRWFVTAPRTRYTSVTASHFGRGKTVSSALRAAQLSALDTYLGPSDQLRYRSGTTFPCDPQPAAQRHRRVPGLLWSPLTMRFTQAGHVTEQLASALACAVIVVGARLTLADAAWRLGSVTTAPAVSRVLQRLRTANNWAGMRAALIRIADALDAGSCPIDYERRRALPFSQLTAGDEWHEIFRATKVQADPPMRLQLVRCWMFERMTGSPAHRCPTADRTREFRLKLSELGQSMTPNLAARLDRSATQFLDKHGCGEEPLLWRPSDKLISV